MDLSTYKLGETDELIEVELKDDLEALILAMSQQAQHQILIFSHNLDNRLFGSNELFDAIKELAIKDRRSHIHILVQDTKHMVQTDHQLMKLSRRISSHMQIKVTAREHRDVIENFIIFDDRGYIVQDNPARYDGSGNFYAPLKTRQLSEHFLEMWEHGVVDSSLRQLSL